MPVVDMILHEISLQMMLLVIPTSGGAGCFEAMGNGVWLNQIEATALLALS